jgi:hypothetical protein
MLRRAAEVYRQAGIRGLWFGALARICYRRLDLVELSLTPPPAIAESPFPLDFGFLDESDVAAYAELGAGVTVEEALLRLKRGERCFVVRADGSIVSGRWVAARRAFVSYLDRWLELGPDEVYVYETYTRSAERGHAVSAAGGTRLARVLAGEGVRRVVAAVLPENGPGQRAYRKASYRRVGTIGYVKLGPWRRHFLRRRPAGGDGR